MATLMKGHTLAKALALKKLPFSWPLIAEVKEDEIRCEVRRSTSGSTAEFYSFSGKPLHNLGGFGVGFQNLMIHHNITSLDIGVLVNKNFNDSYRWTQSSRKVPEGLGAFMVEFIVFDVPEWGVIEYAARRFLVREVARSGAILGLGTRTPVEYGTVESAEAALALFDQVRQSGYEGLMLKDLRGVYAAGRRTYDWLKVKPEADEDGVIQRIIQAISLEGEPLGRAGSVEVAVPILDVSGVVVGHNFASPSGIPHALGRDMFENPGKYKGEWCEFKYMERDRQGGYRHPVFHRVREAK